MGNASTRILFGLLTLLVGCASLPPVVATGPENPGDRPVAVYVLGHGWHTGIVVPAGEMLARLPALKSRFGDASFIEFGWGDRDFYQAGEITAGLALKASLWPTPAVMHVAAVPAAVSAYFPRSEVHRLCLSRSGFEALLRFIAGSFHRADGDGLLPLGRGLYGDSHFYEAVGDYTLFNTCNTWTAKGLKSAGFDIDPATKATAGSVMEYLREVDPPNQGGCGAEWRGRGLRGLQGRAERSPTEADAPRCG